MPQRDTFAPLNQFRTPPRGLGQNVDMTGGETDPLAELKEIQAQTQQQEIQAMQMRQLALARSAQETKMQEETEKSLAAIEVAKAEREEAAANRAQAHKDRMAAMAPPPPAEPGGSLQERFMVKVLEQGEQSQKQVLDLKDDVIAGMKEELAAVRQETRDLVAGKGQGRPYDQMEEDLGRLKSLRELILSFTPTPQLAALGAETNMSIQQIQMTQEFELRREQMVNEREERQRRWDDERQRRTDELEVRRQELEVSRDRNKVLGDTLQSITPKIADAFGGMRTGPPPRPAYGGGPVAAEEGPNGSVLCLNCGTPIPIFPDSVHIQCPACGNTYDLNRD